ncbi:MAG: hypothetical protein R2864_07570 [Syntrophotaleaceae bacterium]
MRIIRKPLNYLTSLISTLVTEAFEGPEDRVRYEDDSASSSDRAIGTYLAGTMSRGDGTSLAGGKTGAAAVSAAGHPRTSLAAFNIPRINYRVEGAAQDGVGKSATGGKVVVLKGENRQGQRVGGSVGKGSFGLRHRRPVPGFRETPTAGPASACRGPRCPMATGDWAYRRHGPATSPAGPISKVSPSNT